MSKAGSSPQPVARPQASLSRGLVLLMAVGCGLSVASMYYAQPLLADIRRSFHLSTSTAGLVVSVTQAGYIAGLLLLVPLGDLVARRRLVPAMLAAVALALAAVAASPDPVVLMVSFVAVGALSVGAQITVALAASLAPEAERGRVVGTVMSGLLLGILLARTAAGYLADFGGWRTPYVVGALAMAALAALMAAKLPAEPLRPALRYRSLVVSTFTILAQEPLLRLRCAFGALAFAGFSALWTPLAFLLSGPPYHYSTGTIGLFGLLGVAGATTASVAGRVADRGRAGLFSGITCAALLVAWVPLGLGKTSLAALVAGVVLLDFATQGLHITNQSVIYKLRPEARSRITSAYMSIYFVGGLIGSVGSTDAYASGGWGAVSLLGTTFGAVAIAIWVWSSRATRPRTSPGDFVPEARLSEAALSDRP